MSDSDYISEVYYKIPGDPAEHRLRWMNLHPSIAEKKTLKKYKNAEILYTSTRPASSIDKCIPPPPDGFKFARFKVKTRKNRFGREVSAPAEEMDFDG